MTQHLRPLQLTPEEERRAADVARRSPPPPTEAANHGPACALCGGALRKTTITERSAALYVIGCGGGLFFGGLAVVSLVSVLGAPMAIVWGVLAFGCLLLGAKRRKVWRCASCSAIAAERA